MKYGLFGGFIAKEGKRNELRDILLSASELLEQNSDCIHYVISTSTDPNAVWVYETWTNKEAHDASLAPENIRALIQQAMPLIESMGAQTELSVIGGKGL